MVPPFQEVFFFERYSFPVTATSPFFFEWLSLIQKR